MHTTLSTGDLGFVPMTPASCAWVLYAPDSVATVAVGLFSFGIKVVLSHKISCLIPSWILTFAYGHLPWTPRPGVSKVKSSYCNARDLLILLAGRKCPRPATADPDEPHTIKFHAKEMFSVPKLPSSLKGSPSQARQALAPWPWGPV